MANEPLACMSLVPSSHLMIFNQISDIYLFRSSPHLGTDLLAGAEGLTLPSLVLTVV
jgi:hypothetical protein